MLDHSTYLYGIGMGDSHAHDNLPILVGAGCRMRGGRHIRYEQSPPSANLPLTLLNQVGVPMETFTGSDGTVEDLFDPVTL